MTTAHRPTWKAAVAQGNESGFGQKSSVQSVRDIASHTKLKVRSGHQYIESRDSRIQASLEKIKQAEEQLGRLKENAKQIQLGLMPARKVNPATEKEGKKKLLLLHDGKDEIDENALRKKYDDSDELPKNATSDGWSDDDSEKLDGSFSDSSSDDDDDDDDDEVALQAELLKIRREREESAARKAAEEAAEEAARMEEIAVTGNPLLAGAGGNVGKSSKRRWNEDTVFRNQARDAPSGQHKKRFVNDTVRNDFPEGF
eukprot:CAMPEP_0113313240 /NCGR_PEP_ID=MMETSP0010_2-20120614/9740_1 /TAXON_ID=216773 ORGANISM="Corethron hystrix, Strain 308" /NCGR_SAMPLE_ID=MMETSP0010_2 /ASSEMBLY_ACC=CAM_ASM_000155 /LENGTH=256 /DNA_ID=CAMNT_0000169207 /DNA_START=117 /DNA_END=888 /DNA_ORIENTATION=- /assembly_acc=CAM_ASM_000155